jgi:hypothetical protein
MDVLRERGIEPYLVEQAAREPQWVEPDPADPQVRRHFQRLPQHGGRYLRVAVVETTTEILIVTAFLDRRARPR